MLELAGTGDDGTTGLLGGTSMWGSIESVKAKGIDTVNARPINLALMGNLPVMYDEFGDKDPEKVKLFLRMITEGEDKQRATQTGGLAAANSRWSGRTC